MLRTTRTNDTADTHTTTIGRIARLTAAVAALSSVALGALPAGAAPIGGGTGGGTADIAGTITTGSCDSAPRVTASWSVGGVPATSTASVVRTSAGRFTYRLATTAPALVTVRGTAPSTCPYGTWTRQSGSVSVADGASVTGPTLGYVPPRKITTLPGIAVAGAARNALAGMHMHLNSYQSAVVNGSHYIANDSYVDISGKHTVLSIPNVSQAMRPCSLCPSFGTAQFHIADLNSATSTATWDPTVGLRFNLGFESAGTEIRGFYRNNTTGLLSDGLMPDLQVNSATIKATLLPVLDGQGGITMAPSAMPTFSGTVYATGACSVAAFVGLDLCSLATNYRKTVATTFTQGALTGLQSVDLKSQIATQFRSALDALGVGTVRNVVAQGDNILVIE